MAKMKPRFDLCLFSILIVTLISYVEACQNENEGCSVAIGCCKGFKCDNGANPFGFCKKGNAPAPSPGSATKPPSKPTTTRPTPKPTSGGSSKYLITKDEFKKAVTINSYPTPTDEQYENINKRAFNGKISTRREMAMFLANILHESDGLRAKEEYEPISAPDPAHPGKNYHGRGYIQLSYVDNYRKASLALYGDERLVTNPEQVAKNDSIAWDTAFYYWSWAVHSAPGVAEGKFGATIMAINGQKECRETAMRQQAKHRFEMYTKILGILVPGEKPNESGCYN